MNISHILEQKLGLKNLSYFHNLSKRQLFQHAVENDRGTVQRNDQNSQHKAFSTKLGDEGPLVFRTDPDCTGRPVNDTFAVAWPEVEGEIWWKNNLKKFDPHHYQQLLKRVVAHVNRRSKPLYVQDVFVGHDPNYAVPYRFVGEFATHAMFAHNMFPKKIVGIESPEQKQWTMLNVQSFHCDPDRDGCLTSRAVIIDFRHQICLVAGPADYCGLVKKTIFTVMNYLLPNQGYLSMHCSANIGTSGDAAILFGLSGTGKTTLSADSKRQLIGDDETGWTDEGISNLEDGCYAKLIDLNKQAEPVIASALSMAGTIIENVPSLPLHPYEDTHPQDLDLMDRSITENTRFSYPLDCNPNIAPGARGTHPQTIVLLTADAFGVLPPVSILSGDEVMYHFVQGFTARLAGTEIGIKEPTAAFSACFGSPFMAHRPSVYAKLLKDKMALHQARCILLNTGWSGGPAGVAPRISIKDTRALLDAALEGRLHDDGIAVKTDPIFGLSFPTECPGVDNQILDPKNRWKDKVAYDLAANKLKSMFRQNFTENQFSHYGIQNLI